MTLGALSLSVSNATILGTTLSATITNGYNISDTASAILAEYSSNGAGNGSVLGDVASSIATSDASAVAITLQNLTDLGFVWAPLQMGTAFLTRRVQFWLNITATVRGMAATLEMRLRLRLRDAVTLSLSVSNATLPARRWVRRLRTGTISLTRRVQFWLNITATARGMDLCWRCCLLDCDERFIN